MVFLLNTLKRLVVMVIRNVYTYHFDFKILPIHFGKVPKLQAKIF